MKNYQRFFVSLSALAIASILDTTAVHAQSREEGKLQIKGGFTTRALYDFKYFGGGRFAPSSIPLKKADHVDETQQFTFDIPNAGLTIEKKVPFADDEIKFFISVGLSKEKISLGEIYASHKKLRLGLTKSNFCNPSAMPAVLGGAPCSAVSATVGQVAWRDQLNEVFNYTLAVEDPLQQELYPGIKEEEKDKQELKTKKGFPALAGNIKYEQKDLFHAQLGVLFRSFQYHHTTKKQDESSNTWGANISGEYKFIPEKTALKLHLIYGKSMGSYILDFAGTPKEEPKDFYLKNGTEVTPVHAWGGYIGVEHCWLPQIRSTVAYGLLNTIDDKGRDENAYRQGHHASGNVTFHPTDYFTTGIEYLYGKRFSVKDGDAGNDAHRIQAIAKFSL